MRSLRLLAGLGLSVLCAPALQAQAAKPPVLTPEQRASEQAKLNAQAAQLDAAMPLAATKEQLRKDITPLRDTLITLSAVVVRLQRAHVTNTPSVVTSSAKQLRPGCAGAANVAIALQPKVSGLKVLDAHANAVIDKYRASLADLVRGLQTCDKAFATELEAKEPAQSRLNDLSGAAQSAIDHYTEAQRNLMDLLAIRLLPKGYRAPHS